jgi:hypothetical protein
MSCEQVNTLEAAMVAIPSSVLPIGGLRRDSDGNLTTDAMRMIVDGLKSRGINPTDPQINMKIRQDLAIFLCSLNNQYQFLMKELLRKVAENEDITREFMNIIKEKNITMQDVINTSGYLQGVLTLNPGRTFIEGWQNTDSTTLEEYDNTVTELQGDMNALNSKNYVELRKHMVDVTQEKNKMASTYLGVYGFMNLVAVGLLIYIAAAQQVKK